MLFLHWLAANEFKSLPSRPIGAETEKGLTGDNPSSKQVVAGSNPVSRSRADVRLHEAKSRSTPRNAYPAIGGLTVPALSLRLRSSTRVGRIDG